MSGKKYWDDEWPNLNSISILLNSLSFEMMTPKELGICYKLVWFVAVKSVHSFYSEIEKNPSVPVDRIPIIAKCSKSEVSSAWDAILEVFECVDGQLFLKIEDAIRLSKDRQRSSISVETSNLVALRDGAICVYCGTTTGPFHKDHLFPFSKGGDNSSSNIVTACQECNLSKSDKTLREWMSQERGQS